MTPAELAPYRAYWKQRNAQKPTPEQLALVEAARTEATRLAQILAQEFGVTKVYLFGSHVWGQTIVRPESDIDLAVEGLVGSKLFAAYDRLEESTHYEVDVVRLEKATTSLRDFILQYGVILYDTHNPQTPSANSAE